MEKVKEYAFSTILDTPYEDAISGVTGALRVFAPFTLDSD